MPKVNQSEINDVAWRACDTFRGVVDAENYRNYILVMLFWKYMSDVWLDHRDAYLKEIADRIKGVLRGADSLLRVQGGRSNAPTPTIAHLS